ncbi:NAF1-domain-containing protein [Calocera cornea HHB12733]|uniref:NAF1-domain-containing protein n=1 Tax=Calocera cornea HHB12733 TaxID=1353952 RepID=A0A165E559_9BASI|nr:NAF1-domain-containing protein [Calocera cornea HHB12733]
MGTTAPPAPLDVPQDLAMLMEMVQADVPVAPPVPIVLPIRLPIKVLGTPEPVSVQVEPEPVTIKSEPVTEKLEPAEEGEVSDHEVVNTWGAPAEVHVVEAAAEVVEPSPPEVKSDAASEEVSAEDGEDSNEDSESEDDDDEEESDESSDSEEEVIQPARGKAPPTAEADEVDDEGGGPTGLAAFASKNEIVTPDVNVPDFDEISPDDKIENIGEIMNIVDSVVVVKGRTNAQYQVIDTGSLLVFEDRKVFETFGAVTQPLYSVRFPSASSIDKERVAIARAVFHVPDRSNYVFTRHLLLLKGSDASNIHDEEVSDGDIEFSDDEKEMEYKRQKKLKRRRGDNFPPDRNQPPEDQVPDIGLDYGDSTSMDVDPRAARGPPVRYDDDDFGMGDEVAGVGAGGHPLGTEGIPDGDEGEEEGVHRLVPERASYPPRDEYTPAPSGRALSPTSEAIARVTGQYDDRPGPSQPRYQESYTQSAPQQDTYDPRAPSMAPPISPNQPYPGPAQPYQAPSQPYQATAQPYPAMQFPMGGYINPRFAFAPGVFPAMNPAYMYAMQQHAAMGQQRVYTWSGQQQQQPPPQQQAGYPPQDGRGYEDGGGENHY